MIWQNSNLVRQTTVMPREVIKNRGFWRFFVNILVLVCRAVTIFLLTQRTRLGGPFKYLEPIENFPGAFEKKFQPKKWSFVRIFQHDFELRFYSFSELKLFFQMSLENFLWTLRTCSRCLKGPPNLALCVSKKIMATSHDAPIRFYFRKSEKS